jgi:hypothetical protein
MGGGVSGGLFPNTVGSKSRGEETNSLFGDEVGNDYSALGQNGNFSQGGSVGFASEGIPVYSDEPVQDEEKLDIFSLFVFMCCLLAERFAQEKNKKLSVFLAKLGKIETIDKESLKDSLEFKSFQKYCKNPSFQQFSDYDVVRRFMTKHFSDSNGVFMKLKLHEWKQYINRFLKKVK